MKNYHGRTWKQADEFLNAGKNKRTRAQRKLQNNTYLVRQSDGSIMVILHATPVVTYLQDGTSILATGGWQSYTTKDRINNYGPVRVFSVRGTWYVGSAIGTTAPKVQKCRRCRGEGQLPQHCYPRTCWKGYSASPCEHGRTGYHRIEGPCADHGRSDYEQVHFHSPCWGCGGTGRRDYGSKPIHEKFVGAVQVSDDGQVLASGLYTPAVLNHPLKATVNYTPKPAAWPDVKNAVGGHTVLAALIDKVPALQVVHACPAEGCGQRRPLQSLIPELNDSHRWTREQIADWLETLDADIRFQVPA